MDAVWRAGTLDSRTKHLAAMAMLATQGRGEWLRSAMADALAGGVAEAELAEVLKMVAVYAGAPAAGDAWRAMQEALREQGGNPPGDLT